MLAQEVEALRSRLGLRQVDVSKECGVNASMLSQWMLGRYKGNIARINGLMESWLVNRRGGKPLDKSNMVLPSPVRASYNMDMMEQLMHAKRCETAGPIGGAALITKEATALVPIRLDVDVDGYRYIDSFSHETDYTFETFSASLIRDLDLPDCFYVPIADAIRKQVEQASPLLPVGDAVPTSPCLVPISLKLRLNDTLLLDTFEWDLSNPANDPDQFARVLCAEMGLSGEFEVQIALSIHEQLLVYSRKERAQDTSARLPPVTQHVMRDLDDAKAWEPKVRYIVADDIALLEREDFKRMRPTSVPAPQPQAMMMPYFPLRHGFNNPLMLVPAPPVKPNRPPKPVNTFLIFCRQWRKKLMAQNPMANAKEASRLLGEMWQKLTEEQRASYQPLADKENAQRMVEWKQKELLDGGGVAKTTTASGEAAGGKAASAKTSLSPNNPGTGAKDDDDDDADMDDDDEDDDDDGDD
ncbi:Aste57867_18077 [Aphanomyces stellatus]|uniref:Aste57867_18077 protein n=1 Tax=Aphanomyces stellatus TaxID=120398 RepID=A0A485L9D7_9STRA|nr:hypothetical protein As57867_018015 [Aphanomyces stellatus]VFT94816.1 Aste57867_18077 [Aphanomyces stellatus]